MLYGKGLSFGLSSCMSIAAGDTNVMDADQIQPCDGNGTGTALRMYSGEQGMEKSVLQTEERKTSKLKALKSDLELFAEELDTQPSIDQNVDFGSLNLLTQTLHHKNKFLQVPPPRLNTSASNSATNLQRRVTSKINVEPEKPFKITRILTQPVQATKMSDRKVHQNLQSTPRNGVNHIQPQWRTLHQVSNIQMDIPSGHRKLVKRLIIRKDINVGASFLPDVLKRPAEPRRAYKIISRKGFGPVRRLSSQIGNHSQVGNVIFLPSSDTCSNSLKSGIFKATPNCAVYDRLEVKTQIKSSNNVRVVKTTGPNSQSSGIFRIRKMQKNVTVLTKGNISNDRVAVTKWPPISKSLKEFYRPRAKLPQANPLKQYNIEKLAQLQNTFNSRIITQAQLPARTFAVSSNTDNPVPLPSTNIKSGNHVVTTNISAGPELSRNDSVRYIEKDLNHQLDKEESEVISNTELTEAEPCKPTSSIQSCSKIVSKTNNKKEYQLMNDDGKPILKIPVQDHTKTLVIKLKKKPKTISDSKGFANDDGNNAKILKPVALDATVMIIKKRKRKMEAATETTGGSEGIPSGSKNKKFKSNRPCPKSKKYDNDDSYSPAPNWGKFYKPSPLRLTRGQKNYERELLEASTPAGLQRMYDVTVRVKRLTKAELRKCIRGYKPSLRRRTKEVSYK